MLFGKHINKYYLRHLPTLLLGLLALVLVDYMQLVIPEMYRMTVNGINDGVVLHEGVEKAFTMDFLLDEICLPLMIVIFAIVSGRFLWRICFRGAAIKMETHLRGRMFDHCKNLSQQYYQVHKVGNLMTLFTNDLETVQDCFGWGVLMFFDALCLGIMALYKMYLMNPMLTLLSLISYGLPSGHRRDP